MNRLSKVPRNLIELYQLRLTENERELYINIKGSVIYFLIDEKFEIRDDKEELFIRNSSMFIYIINGHYTLSNYIRC